MAISKPLVVKQLHRILLRHTDYEGKIRRSELLSTVAKRVGKIEPLQKNSLIKELLDFGVIDSMEREYCVISKLV